MRSNVATFLLGFLLGFGGMALAGEHCTTLTSEAETLLVEATTYWNTVHGTSLTAEQFVRKALTRVVDMVLNDKTEETGQAAFNAALAAKTAEVEAAFTEATTTTTTTLP